MPLWCDRRLLSFHQQVTVGKTRDLRLVRDAENLIGFASFLSFAPTASLTRPPMPVSISSKTMVRGNSEALATVFSTSIKREASPPEATLASGFTVSPTFAEK